MGATGTTARRVRLAIVLGSILALAGCHFVGGGTIRSATGHGKAVFSFNLDCPVGGVKQTGTLTYTDRPAGVLIHGTPDPDISGGEQGEGDICESNNDGIFGVDGTFDGTYVALDGSHATGRFSVDVTVGRSAPPNLKGGRFSITLFGGPFDGYHDSGPIIAGQIQPIGGPDA